MLRPTGLPVTACNLSDDAAGKAGEDDHRGRRSGKKMPGLRWPGKSDRLQTHA
ncbi:hypothetical protein QCD60_10815 [Pokkaliibacter sp. MBI-7]|uniref:hypothetical protein n=1 Tax=Pokkaliibacter sp. MBI-7 TaxID=3040600 RepID=UPI0024475A03|nr:hypothetical protein [Pokkaliibacter sp. MBI-7]MDH2433060.1 hypothetical protein [Pokkaliibacter sp. MBI-7]